MSRKIFCELANGFDATPLRYLAGYSWQSVAIVARLSQLTSCKG